MNKPVLAVLAILAAQPAAAMNPLTVTLESEAPGLQRSTAGFASVGVEDFNGRRVRNNQTFVTDFGGSVFRGHYRGVDVKSADRYGGADGSGNYAATFSSSGYRLDLSTRDPDGINYFGFWLSALDRGNSLTFFSKDQALFTFSASDAKAFIDSLPGKSGYYCNPNASFARQNCGEPYAFLNFYARGNTRFDSVLFAESPEVGGYESDNHTVGRWTRMSGTVVPLSGSVGAVPEPAAWALMLTGFGMVGLTRRRSLAVAA